MSFISNSSVDTLVVTRCAVLEGRPWTDGERDRGSISHACHGHRRGIMGTLAIYYTPSPRPVPLAEVRKLALTRLGLGTS